MPTYFEQPETGTLSFEDSSGRRWDFNLEGITNVRIDANVDSDTSPTFPYFFNTARTFTFEIDTKGVTLTCSDTDEDEIEQMICEYSDDEITDLINGNS